MGKVGSHCARSLAPARACIVGAASVVTCVLAFASGDALAAGRGAGKGPKGGNAAPGAPAGPPVDTAAATPAEAARARAKAGDCAAALDGFDQAARATIEPTVRRDRGLCHEQLGHPYPAIDDYRYYLTNRPNASDADDIHNRLMRLEEQVGIVSPDKGGSKDKSDTVDKADDPGKSSASMSVSLNGVSQPTTSGGRSLDKIENDEQLDIDADGSPLRRGTGFEIGLAIGGQRFTRAELGWAELVGLDIRYSVSSVSTLLLEFGFTHVNADGSASALGGASISGGYEARIALDPRLNDALLLGATVGYQHLSQAASGLVYGAFVPQLRFGYRHVFGPALGLEAALDGGLAVLHLTGAPAGVDANATSGTIGGHVGLVLGF